GELECRVGNLGRKGRNPERPEKVAQRLPSWGSATCARAGRAGAAGLVHCHLHVGKRLAANSSTSPPYSSNSRRRSVISVGVLPSEKAFPTILAPRSSKSCRAMR